MIPLKIHRYKPKPPLVTILLIILNTGLFLTTYYSKNFTSIVEMFAFKLGPQAFWTWFTAMFLHANWLHLAGNMVFLYVFGSLLENVLSRLKYLLLYILGGFTSALVQGLIFVFFQPSKVEAFAAIGSSGAIFALLGVIMIRFRKNKVTWYVVSPLFLLELMLAPNAFFGPIGFISGSAIFLVILAYGFQEDVPFWQLLTIWPIFTVTALTTGLSYLFLQISFGVQQIFTGNFGGVAYWAHAGGLLAGIVMVRYLGIADDARKEYLAQDAASLARQGRFKEAAEIYQQIINRGAKDPYFLHKAGKAWALAGNLEKSVVCFKRAFYSYYQAGKKEEASQVYEDIQNFIPEEHFDAKTELAFASLCQAQYKLEAALTGYAKVLQNYPHSKQAELALFRSAQVYQKMGDFRQANNMFAKFVKKYPSSQWCSLAKQYLAKKPA